MWCEPLTCKHSNMRNTFNIQMKKNCFLAIKAPCSLGSQPDNVVKSECKSCSDSSLIYLFVSLLMYFAIRLFFSCCFTIFLWESGIFLPGCALQCTLGVTWQVTETSTHYGNGVYNKNLELCNHSHSCFKVNCIYLYIYVIWSLINGTAKFDYFI